MFFSDIKGTHYSFLFFVRWSPSRLKHCSSKYKISTRDAEVFLKLTWFKDWTLWSLYNLQNPTVGLHQQLCPSLQNRHFGKKNRHKLRIVLCVFFSPFCPRKSRIFVKEAYIVIAVFRALLSDMLHILNFPLENNNGGKTRTFLEQASILRIYSLWQNKTKTLRRDYLRYRFRFALSFKVS